MLISRACYTLSVRIETKPQMCLFLFALSAFIAKILLPPLRLTSQQSKDGQQK